MEDLHPCNTCGVLEQDDDESDFWEACNCGTVPYLRALLMYLHLKPISALIVVCEYCLFLYILVFEHFNPNFKVSV